MKNYEIMGRGVHLLKTFILLCLMILDVYFSFHILYVDAGKKLTKHGTINDINFSVEEENLIYVIGVHFIVHLSLLFWMFFLIWKTFLFRFRIGTLCKDYAFLFILFVLNFTLYVLETAVYVV